MKRWLGLMSILAIIAPSFAAAQAKPDFSGKWIFNQAKSGRGAAGNSPVVPFPSEIVVKQTAAELYVQASTVRQEGTTAVYKFDGTEVTVGAPEGISEKAKVAWDGSKLIITSRRSFTSPIGDVITDFKEVWTLNGNVLTIDKTQTADGHSDTVQAVFEKNAG
jgi:hypothetical protein